MAIKVLTADLEKDQTDLIDILNQNRDYPSGYERYKWLYLDNPAGKAQAWLAKDTDTGINIGAAAALPRMIWTNGKTQLCHVLSDFSIGQSYRTMGPAIKLNKISVSPVADGLIPFAYDFPSREMTLVHTWCKVRKLTQFSRYLLPINASLLSERYPVLKKASIVMDAGLRGLLHLFQAATYRGGYTYTHHLAGPESFDPCFDELDAAVGPKFSLCGSRTSAYLAWRYGANPLQRFRLIKLFFKKQFCGYAVGVRTSRNRLQVYDLFCDKRPGVMKAWIHALVAVALKKKYHAVEIELPDTSNWAPFLKKYCFQLRESTIDMFVFSSKEYEKLLLTWPDNGHMTLGDRDT